MCMISTLFSLNIYIIRVQFKYSFVCFSVAISQHSNISHIVLLHRTTPYFLCSLHFYGIRTSGIVDRAWVLYHSLYWLLYTPYLFWYEYSSGSICTQSHNSSHDQWLFQWQMQIHTLNYDCECANCHQTKPQYQLVHHYGVYSCHQNVTSINSTLCDKMSSALSHIAFDTLVWFAELMIAVIISPK